MTDASMTGTSMTGTSKTDSAAQDRLINDDVIALPLEHQPGEHTASLGYAGLYDTAGVRIGVWEAGTGQDRDTEADEVFLVLTGRATITFSDGSALELKPGVLARFHAGDKTVWDVTETLRKLYILLPSDAD